MDTKSISLSKEKKRGTAWRNDIISGKGYVLNSFCTKFYA